jgi:hypothetical protein
MTGPGLFLPKPNAQPPLKAFFQAAQLTFSCLTTSAQPELQVARAVSTLVCFPATRAKMILQGMKGAAGDDAKQSPSPMRELQSVIQTEGIGSLYVLRSTIVQANRLLVHMVSTFMVWAFGSLVSTFVSLGFVHRPEPKTVVGLCVIVPNSIVLSGALAARACVCITTQCVGACGRTAVV